MEFCARVSETREIQLETNYCRDCSVKVLRAVLAEEMVKREEDWEGEVARMTEKE
jgi:hypothetical protein